MADIKKQIISWFYSPQDYDQGLKLLEQVSKKNKVLGKLIRRGKTRSSVEKLIWELNKVAGLKKIPTAKQVSTAAAYRPAKAPAQKKIQKTGKEERKLQFNLIGKNDIADYPPEVRRLVKEYSSLYMQRGKKHAALRRLPEDNSKETITERVRLIAEIKTVSDRLELLFKSFSEFETGGSFDAVALWPGDQTKAPDAGRNDESVEELKAQKKNLQSSIVKDRNLLLYSGKTKQEKPNPMPEGPKRTRLERRVTKKEAEILALDQRIAELE